MALFPGYTEDFENGCEQMNLSMRGIVKSFGANDVLKSVDFSLRGGEICALLGENGAGKSTLMNILGGVLRPDAGQILLDDKPQIFQNPSQSLDAGIAFIHQELNLINDLPIYENMFIGRELKKKNGFLDHPRMIAETRKVFERMALTLDPRTMVRDLDASYKQIVEISRALLMNAQIIIMDEPTTSLTDPEIEHVFEILRTLKKQNVGIVFISHKLREVMEICDRYTVLRDGVMVSEGYVRDVTTDLLARDMVGHDVRNEPLNRSVKLGDEVLRLEDLTQEPHYRHISLSVRAGEVLGIAGVDGNGQTELSELISGTERPSAGTIELAGEDVTKLSVAQRISKNLSFVPAERNGIGAIGQMSIAENVILRDYHKKPYAKGIVLNREEALKATEKFRNLYEIKLASPDMPAEQLSGGNLQKVILARELNRNPKALVCVNPTRGLDVGAIENVHNSILETRKYGTGVLLISTELEEILSLSDRIAVMFEGRIMGILENKGDLDMDKLGLMMVGAETN